MKKINLIVASAALAGAFVAAPASAQFFVGLGAGKSMVNEGSFNPVAGVTVSGLDSNETSWQVNGGYMFDKNWGVIVQYTDLGSRNGTVCNAGVCQGTQDVKAYQWGVAGLYKYDFGNDFFAQGKLGVSSNHVDGLSGTVNGVAFSTSGNSNTDILAGIGVGYNWSKNVSTRLEYEYFGKFESSNGGASAKGSNIGLRFQYTFD